MKHHAVFISYRSVNETFASGIKSEIEKHFPGLGVFLSSHDEDGTTLGKAFQPEIREKIATCAFVVLVLTNDWAQSDKCREEYEIAKSEDKTIFALFLESEDAYVPELKAIERELGSETFAKVYPSSVEVAAKRVIGGLKKYIEKSEAYERAFFAFEGDNPYPGLGVYDIDEAAVYFGRESETHDLLRLFFKRPEEKKRFLLVHGASGSGKSSFMRAGILARIVLFYNDWHLLGGNAFRPGEDPLRSLCHVFAKASGEGFADVKKRVENKEDFTDLLWALKGERRYLLLAVDQLEELYQNREAHEAFFEALRLYLQTDGCYLIATVRTEYLQDIQSEVLDKERNMAQIMEVYNLPPISIGAIDDIITGPFEAKIAKGKIERGFVDSLKHDLAGKTKALPLLSLYLETHYERYGGHFLAKDYVSGKLFSTIDEKASEALEGIDEDDKEKLKEAFIRHLVFFDKTYDKALRKRASYEELFEVHKWIDRLIDARLLVKEIKGDDATVEVVHEAVFEHWKLLNGWIEEEKDFFALLKKAELHFEDWKLAKEKKKNEALLGGLLLEEALKVKERLGDELKDFVEKSDKFFKKTKRKRTLSYIVMSSAIVLFGVFGFVQALTAKEKAVEAQRNADKALSNFANYKQSQNKLNNLTLFIFDYFTKNITNKDIIDEFINEIFNTKKELIDILTISLIKTSKAIETEDEKRNWINVLLPRMTSQQKRKLIDILIRERLKLAEIHQSKQFEKKLIIKKYLSSSIDKYKKYCENNLSKVSCIKAALFMSYTDPYKALVFLDKVPTLTKKEYINEYIKALNSIIKGLSSDKEKVDELLDSFLCVNSIEINNLKSLFNNFIFYQKYQKIAKCFHLNRRTILNINQEKYKTFISVYISLSMMSEALQKYDKEIISLYKIHNIFFDKNKKEQSKVDIDTTVIFYRAMTRYFLLTKQYKLALHSIKRALRLNPDRLELQLDLAHSYLFTNNIDNAIEIYLKYKGEKIENNAWEDKIRNDFADFNEKNITSPYFSSILKMLEK